MKTTVSVQKQHYVDVCNELANAKIKFVSVNCFDIVDIFQKELTETGGKQRFGHRVTSYMKGW
jgi:hypothetical protein